MTSKGLDFLRIKLIIWDLDDTFWKGTLSEGGITPINQHIDFIKILTDRGIVNSICSKNDKEVAENQLAELDILDYFVFRSIDWSPKGQRISKLIKDMGLRPQNCLFIDDNILNLNEALFYEPQLMVMGPEEIPALIKLVHTLPINDTEHKRLNNYKILEQKQEAKEKASDNIEFLYDSNIQIGFHSDYLNQIERIYELVNRTNQLNYTKVRSSKEEIIDICSDQSVQSGYITVKDKYGDYGIVGFYAIKENKLLHFLFSCRVIGQGVEQYVYARLGYPQLKIVGDVISQITLDDAPSWITEYESNCISDRQRKDKNMATGKIVFKGACDLKQMAEYLQTDQIIEEFTYIGSKGNNIEHHNHSINYLTWPSLSEKDSEMLIKDCIFNDISLYDSAIYDNDVSLIILQTMTEPNLGIYKNKKTGIKIAWGEYIYPLTDKNNWDLYVNGSIFTADNDFTYEWLEDFSNKYEYIGTLSPEEILENIKTLLQKINPKAKVCLLLGSETPYKKNSQKNYDGRHSTYKKINDLIREYAKSDSRILIIDLNDYIRDQSDFTDNINHFKRRIYFEVATKANEYIFQLSGSKLNQKSKFYLQYKTIKDIIGSTGFYQTKFYKYLSSIRNFIFRR